MAVALHGESRSRRWALRHLPARSRRWAPDTPPWNDRRRPTSVGKLRATSVPGQPGDRRHLTARDHRTGCRFCISTCTYRKREKQNCWRLQRWRAVQAQSGFVSSGSSSVAIVYLGGIGSNNATAQLHVSSGPRPVDRTITAGICRTFRTCATANPNFLFSHPSVGGHGSAVLSANRLSGKGRRHPLFRKRDRRDGPGQLFFRFAARNQHIAGVAR